MIGGDCTWTGCVPSKTLLHAARLAHQARNSAAFGIDCGNVLVEFPRVIRQVHATIERVYAFETPQVLKEEGITVMHGAARFRDAHTLVVDGTPLRGRYVVICTGATPTTPPLPGIDSVAYLTSANVFALRDLPARLIVLGGGAIGVELAQAFQRLGSEVTLIEANERLLGFADPAASEVIADTLRGEGVQVRLGEAVERVSGADGGVRIVMRGGDITGDRLLVATGRRPNTVELDLHRAGVEVNAHAIAVSDDLRTSRSTSSLPET